MAVASARFTPKRPLPDKVPPAASFRLTDCHRLLAREFGDSVPSLVTLKRHAAAGDLKAFQIRTPENSHPKYLYERIRKHYGTRRAPTLKAERAHGLASAGLGHVVSPADLIGAVRAELAPALREVTEQLLGLRNEVRGLATLRQSLMQKYDASHAAALLRAERAEEQLREVAMPGSSRLRAPPVAANWPMPVPVCARGAGIHLQFAHGSMLNQPR